MSVDYPLRFAPIFRRYLWGGRRLATLLGKEIGAGHCAESWEIVDHGKDQSVVTNGPLAGARLTDIVRQHGDELFGRHAPLDHFPLLFKFLDAQKTLSVQVHPNDAQGALLDPPDLGKTEAWVVLAAEPGSKIYAGVKRGFDRHALEREVRRGTCELCLNAFEPKPGDCLFIPAGTVHALGEGLVIAEIQQASDSTFRLFDFNRVDADGRPRTLHIDQALDVIDFERGPVGTVQPEVVEGGVERLVACDKFVLQRRRLSTAARPTYPGRSSEARSKQENRLRPGSFAAEPSVKHAQRIGGDNRFHLLAVLDGEVEVSGSHQPVLLQTGDTTLLPASVRSTELHPVAPATLLDICLP